MKAAPVLVALAVAVTGCGGSTSHASSSSGPTTADEVVTTLARPTTTTEPPGTVHVPYRGDEGLARGYTYDITATPPSRLIFATAQALPGNVDVGLASGGGGVMTIRNTTTAGRDAPHPGTAYEVVLRFPGGCPPPTAADVRGFMCSTSDAQHGYSSVFLRVIGNSNVISAHGELRGPASTVECWGADAAEVPDNVDRSVFYWRITTPNSPFVSSDGTPAPSVVLKAGASPAPGPGPFDALEC